MSDEAERVRNEKLGRPFRPHPEERVSASRRMGAATNFGLPEIDYSPGGPAPEMEGGG